MLFGKSDLIDRWIYSRQGVYKALQWADFPVPYLTADRGRLDAWRREDIEAFELNHPELTDEAAKAVKSRDRSRKAKGCRLRTQIAEETFLGPRDIADRWSCGSQQVYRAARNSKEFPRPSFVFNRAKSRVWGFALIEELERKHGGNPAHMDVFYPNRYSQKDLSKTFEVPRSGGTYPDSVTIGSDESRRVAEEPGPVPNRFG